MSQPCPVPLILSNEINEINETDVEFRLNKLTYITVLQHPNKIPLAVYYH